jgi:hypothetical protein
MNKFFDKKEDGFFILYSLSFIIPSFLFLKYANGGVFYGWKPVALLFFLLGVFFSYTHSRSTKSILPKMLSILLLIYISKFLIELIIKSNSDEDGYWGFHISFFIEFVLLCLVFLLFLEILETLFKRALINGLSLKSINKTVLFLITVLWLVFGKSTFNRVLLGFTHPNEIAKKLYEDSSISYKIGAYCNDGWESDATGSGACSHHGGVELWKYKTFYLKSKGKCYQEALEISWIE